MGGTFSAHDMLIAQIPKIPQNASDRRQQLIAALLSNQDGMVTVTRQRLIRLAQLRGVAPDAIEDVVQETLLQAWQHLDRLHTPEGFPLWIDEICRNICRRTAHRQQTEQLRFVPFWSSHALTEEKTGESENVNFAIAAIADPHALDDFDALNRQDLHVLLDRVLGMLPDGARAAVESCDLLELPHREAAARLGLSVSALETRLHRAHRSLRHLLSGPLRAEAESLGLMLEPVTMAEWHETRLWCSLCGRRRLHGMFLPSEPEGSQNLHLRCPACAQRFGLDIIHSMGLVQLDGLRSFRPAWKRTMQELTDQLTSALARGWYPCPRCETQAFIKVVDSNEPITSSSHPYQFSIEWQCSHCGGRVCTANELPSVSEIVYWSHPQTRQFILQHPQLLTMPERLVEYAGQPAICVQMSDTTSTSGMTVLAHRQTLDVLLVDKHGR